MASLLGELRRRNVFRVGIAYLVVAWLVIQIVATVFPLLDLPEWSQTLIVVLIIVGFPFALVFAWAYELTPEGLKRSREIPSAQSLAKSTGRKIDFIIIGFLVLAVGFLLADDYLFDDRQRDVLPNSIAVLPFDNLSPDPDDAYFSAGIHEQIISELAKLRDLNVIGRTTVMEYLGATRPLTDIADELSVEMLMEGSVRYASDQVRVTAQLIDGATGTHIWNDDYDGDLRDIFAIQSEIATAIADALQATLSPQEVARLGEAPTKNTRAYELYLSGRQYSTGSDPIDAEFAVQQYQLAVEEDPQFALAWARLGVAHADLYMFSVDRGDQRRMDAFSAAGRALELQPDLPEAHVARSVYYTVVVRDYDQALRHVEIAEQGAPGDPEVIGQRGFVYRRLGEWNLALENLERAIELDPRNVFFIGNGAASTHLMLRNYDQAEAYYNRALEIEPDASRYHIAKAQISFTSDGDVSALRALAENPPVNLGDEQQWLGWLAAVYERDYQTALDYLEELDSDPFASGTTFYAPKSSFYGVAYALMGRPEQAEGYFLTARNQIETALDAAPDDYRLLIAYGEILAGLGEMEEAVSQARRAMELMPVSLDPIDGSSIRKDAIVRVLAPAGADDLAIEELDTYLSAPGAWSIEGLLPDPRLDPIRDDPRFQALVEKHARE